MSVYADAFHSSGDRAMNLTQVFLDQLDREAVRTRRALEKVS